MSNPTTPREMIAHLQRENAALRELMGTLGAPNHINVPVEQWRELRKDSERLDWLIINKHIRHPFFPADCDLARSAIDAARKEAQP